MTRGDIGDFTNSAFEEDSVDGRYAWAAGDISTAIVQNQRREVPVGKHAVIAGNPDDDRTYRILQRSRETLDRLNRQDADDPDRAERSRAASDYQRNYEARLAEEETFRAKNDSGHATRSWVDARFERFARRVAEETCTGERSLRRAIETLAKEIGEATGRMERNLRHERECTDGLHQAVRKLEARLEEQAQQIAELKKHGPPV